MPRLKERPEAVASGQTRFRDELAGSIFQTIIAVDRPSTFSETSWEETIRKMARRAWRAAEIFLEETPDGQ